MTATTKLEAELLQRRHLLRRNDSGSNAKGGAIVVANLIMFESLPQLILSKILRSIV